MSLKLNLKETISKINTHHLLIILLASNLIVGILILDRIGSDYRSGGKIVEPSGLYEAIYRSDTSLDLSSLEDGISNISSDIQNLEDNIKSEISDSAYDLSNDISIYCR